MTSVWIPGPQQDALSLWIYGHGCLPPEKLPGPQPTFEDPLV